MSSSECKKRGSEFEFSDDFLCKKSKSPANNGVHDGDGEDIFAWLSEIDEEAVGELMSLLDKEMTSSSEVFAAAKVKFIDDPYTSQSVFQCSSSYVTINGNEESCGSSFSYSDSSVMASLNVGGQGSFVCDGAWRTTAEINNGAWSEEDEVARYLVNEDVASKMCVVDDGIGMNGCDEFDFEDVLLARFLGEDLL